MAIGAASVAGQTPPGASDLRLTFNEPAKEWSEAIPVGNGRLGAMIFGHPRHELIQLNEDTLWSGFPRDCTNSDAINHLPQVRQAVMGEQDYVKAGAICKQMQGPFNQSYQPLADVHLDFADTGPITEFERSLDLDTAVATVRYKTGDVQITRETLASAVDQIIAIRFQANVPGQLNFRVSLTSQLHSETKLDGTTLTISGKAPANVVPNYWRSDSPVVYDDAEGRGMRFAAILRINVPNAQISADGEQFQITGAQSCTILISAATGYRGYDSPPDLSQSAVLGKARAPLDSGATKTWPQIRDAHMADHQKLFRRVSLQLVSNTKNTSSTPERLATISDHADPSLLALYFQFGRYLLIASSRPGTQPANLQGIWNADVRPPWSSNWTANINVQMNYWPAETCNLSECHGPLLDLVKSVSQTGARTAKVNYSLDGWVSHHNIDLWRQSAPVGLGNGSPTWANWPMSGPWLCAHLWDHYLFTGDTAFLREAYPLMKGSAQFCLGWLIDDGAGHLTTCPSMSTENDFLTPDGKKAEVSAGCTMDMALIRELFTNCSAAARQFQDTAFAERLDAARSKLLPYRVGKYGQLQEWSLDFDESTPGQRHMSHLYGLYPGSDITPRQTPDFAKAARISLERRLANGGAYTGWSRAWAIAFWARLGDGTMAEESLTMLMKHSTGPSMFDTHPAGKGKSIFQIDGNFGATAAIAEMLVQSHAGEISLLPALPANWSTGSFTGLRVRGGAEVDLTWQNNLATSGALRSKGPMQIKLRAPEKQKVFGHEVANITLKAGETLSLRFS